MSEKTPIIELMNMMGHKKIETTMKYYINENKLENEKLKQNLKDLNFSNAENPVKIINVDDI